MIRFLVKLALAGLIANAVWRIGSEYVNYYTFTDEVRNEAVYRNQTEDQLRERVAAIAADHDLPVDEEDVSVERDERHVVIQGAYTKPIMVLPGYDYPWEFKWSIDALQLAAPLPPKPSR
jgi:hypothetical protein